MNNHNGVGIKEESAGFMRLGRQKWLKRRMDIALSRLNQYPNMPIRHRAALFLLVFCAAAPLGRLALAQPALPALPTSAATDAPTSAPPSTWWITPGAVSYHYQDREQFNQTHPGVGLEYHLNNEWAIVGGTYKNSNYLWSKYGGVNWTPTWLQFSFVKLGATAQVADNYKAARNGKPFAFAAPLIAIEGKHVGANIYVIPTIRNVTGAVALQLKFGF